MKKQSSKKNLFAEKHESKEDVDHQVRDRDEKDDSKAQQSNTIIQQINGFAITPMNDKIAAQTIEDHRYLLELVENKAAIAYFAILNRNHALFTALRNYYNIE